jgi:hypothetical protein
MKKNKNNKSVMHQEMPVWLAIISALILGVLIYYMGITKMDTRSSANDSVEEGVVLPVASDKE